MKSMKVKVFIADDHPVVLEGLRVLIETEDDLRVVGSAADGRGAVRKVKETCPDVVIMDISMPGQNGIEATRQIREETPASRVIILSMHASREHVCRALQAGAQGYVEKGSVGREVVKAVREVYAGRRYLSRCISEAVINDYLHQLKTSPPVNPLEMLSSREREVLQLVAEGKSSAVIAGILFLSRKTVETYRSRLMQKLGISDIPGLVKFAILHKLIDLE